MEPDAAPQRTSLSRRKDSATGQFFERGFCCFLFASLAIRRRTDGRTRAWAPATHSGALSGRQPTILFPWFRRHCNVVVWFKLDSKSRPCPHACSTKFSL